MGIKTIQKLYFEIKKGKRNEAVLNYIQRHRIFLKKN